ncbi:MAG: hypothetical protein KKH04_11100 [Proteobacteria bacterium]|nr:hypothetical protein [Pseudomonadota bacterium]
MQEILTDLKAEQEALDHFLGTLSEPQWNLPSPYVIVTIAEGLGVRLTERLLHDFEAFHLTVGHLIINHLIQEADCPFHRRRQAMQRKYLRQLKETYGQRMALIEVPLLADEVKGIKRIRDIADILFPEAKKSSPRR